MERHSKSILMVYDTEKVKNTLSPKLEKIAWSILWSIYFKISVPLLNVKIKYEL
jgi:hypothetical protein